MVYSDMFHPKIFSFIASAFALGPGYLIGYHSSSDSAPNIRVSHLTVWISYDDVDLLAELDDKSVSKGGR